MSGKKKRSFIGSLKRAFNVCWKKSLGDPTLWVIWNNYIDQNVIIGTYQIFVKSVYSEDKTIFNSENIYKLKMILIKKIGTYCWFTDLFKNELK